jgi:multidrug efflux pump subunit AcrA (membrane-fusion protein)
VEAIDGSGDAARVFTVQQSGTIQIVPVHLGIETARTIEIRSGELKEGDKVVVGSRSGLKDGAPVQPKIIALATDSAPKQ